MNKIGREVTIEEAQRLAGIGLTKIRKGSNAYALFCEDGRFLWSRDNSSRYVAWKTTGRPFLVGVYDRRCQMPVIANDVLFVAGAQ